MLAFLHLCLDSRSTFADFPAYKANYCDFLHNTAQFHQPMIVRDVTMQQKIHHTYRLQFLKDVVLARTLDDSTFNVLTKAEINIRWEVIILLQRLAIMGKNVQLPARLTLFRTLVDRGILFAVQWALNLWKMTDC